MATEFRKNVIKNGTNQVNLFNTIKKLIEHEIMKNELQEVKRIQGIFILKMKVRRRY